MSAEDRTATGIGRRLKAIRLANGFERQGEFADALGIGRNAYNSWETGAQRPGLTQAFRVVDQFGVSLDFIYRGHLHTLPDSVKKSVVSILNTLRD
jgi:transcriptional regulator with XRE-family HTH domain